MDEEVHGIREFGRALRGGFKEGVKKVVVDGVVNERWISKVCSFFCWSLVHACILVFRYFSRVRMR